MTYGLPILDEAANPMWPVTLAHYVNEEFSTSGQVSAISTRIVSIQGYVTTGGRIELRDGPTVDDPVAVSFVVGSNTNIRIQPKLGSWMFPKGCFILFASGLVADLTIGAGSLGDLFTPPGSVPALSPYMRWKFNDGSGLVLSDTSGNGADHDLGTSPANPAWVAEGLAFDGVDDFTRFDDGSVQPVFDTGDPYTVFLVCKGPASQGPALAVYSEGAFAAGASGENVGSFIAITTAYDATNTQGRLQISRDYLNLVDTTMNFLPNMFDDAWHFFCLRVTATEIKYQLDGTIVSAVPGSTPLVSDRASKTIQFGQLRGSSFWEGEVAWAETYSEALTDAQIAAVRASIEAELAGRGIFLA